MLGLVPWPFVLGLAVLVVIYLALRRDLHRRTQRMVEAAKDANTAQRNALRTVAKVTPLPQRRGKTSAREIARRKARQKGATDRQAAAWLLLATALGLVVMLALGGQLALATIVWGCAAAIVGAGLC